MNNEFRHIIALLNFPATAQLLEERHRILKSMEPHERAEFFKFDEKEFNEAFDKFSNELERKYEHPTKN